MTTLRSVGRKRFELIFSFTPWLHYRIFLLIQVQVMQLK
jgi:hypothetical protein